LPFGVSGKMLSIIKDEKSVISTWLMMKRGVEPIFFIEKENNLLEKLFSWIPGKPIVINKITRLKNVTGIISDKVVEKYKNYPHYDPTFFLNSEQLRKIENLL